MPSPIHVTIPEPCHENWQQMTPNEQGRHCMSCQKTVVDFTLMSDQEILNYISRASSSVCGRFNNHQLDKTYAEKKIRPSFTFRYSWNMIVAAFLLAGNAATAQIKKTARKKTVVQSTWEFKPDAGQQDQVMTLGFVTSTQERSRFIEPPLKMYGLIKDNNTGRPIDAAFVRIKGVKAGVGAGEDGRFEFPVIDLDRKVTLEVSADGYITQDYTVDVNSFHTMEFFLDREAALEPKEAISGAVVGNAVFKIEEQKLPEPESVILGTLAILIPDTVERIVTKHAAIGCAFPEPVIPETTDDIVDSTNSLAIEVPPADSEKDGLPLPAGKDEAPVVLTDTGNVFTGEVAVIQEVTTIQKIKREVKEWLPTKKELRVYPNPVIPGNVVNISLAIGKTGEYKLELMDAAGRLVYVQALQVMQKSQVVNVPTQSSWSRGVYWVRISNATDKKVYQAKVLLQ